MNNYSPLVKEITKLHRVSAKVVPLVVAVADTRGGGGEGGRKPPQ